MRLALFGSLPPRREGSAGAVRGEDVTTAKTAPLDVLVKPDGSAEIVAHAPRDGARRQVSGGDYRYQMTKEDFSKWVDQLVYMRAGT